MFNNALTLSSDCDCRLIDALTPSQRFVEFTVVVPNVAPRADRVPLNLALVLDRSGSMAGSKLPYVQQAACHVLDLLNERDRVAVVAYDDEVRLIAPSEPVTDGRRQQVKNEINALRPGNMTDLGGGWLRGAGEVAKTLMSQGVNRTLLLTDGLANRGITDPKELAHHARELCRRGVSTSTFGVGHDFNEHLLEAMASQGGGHFYFIEHPRDIPAIFRRELGELLTVAARETSLTIDVPSGVAVNLLGDLPHESRDGQLRLFLGDLFAGERRAFYLKVLTPPGERGNTVILNAEPSYADQRSRSASASADAAFTYATPKEVNAAPRNSALLERASEVDMAAAATRALKFEREGRREKARALLQEALAVNASCLSSPAAARYAAMAEEISRGLSETQRKQAHYAVYKLRRTRE